MTFALASAVYSRTDVRRALYAEVDGAEFRRLVHIADRAVANLNRDEMVLYCAWAGIDEEFVRLNLRGSAFDERLESTLKKDR